MNKENCAFKLVDEITLYITCSIAFFFFEDRVVDESSKYKNTVQPDRPKMAQAHCVLDR